MRARIIRTYSELKQIPAFEDRFEYLKLGGAVGAETFGFDRIFNQRFYNSKEWQSVRHYVITRDYGCDLGIEDREIGGRIIIHHMNPIDLSDIETSSKFLLDPNYLISTAHDTHNAIHYGDKDLLMKDPIVRLPNDTCPWKVRRN